MIKEKTIYYVDGIYYPFYNKEEAERVEEDLKKTFINLKEHSSKHKLEKLILDLKNAEYIPEGTIATCSFDSLGIKNMVKVCQKFAEDHKEYLKYY